MTTKKSQSTQTVGEQANPFADMGYTGANKLNSTRIKVGDGERFAGIYQGEGEMPVNPSKRDIELGLCKPGEKKSMKIFRFLDPQTRQPVHVNGDAGLSTVMSSCGASQGELIGLVHLGKTELQDGTSVNQWDAYRLSAAK